MRKLTFLSLLAVLALVLTACRPKPTPTAAPPTAVPPTAVPTVPVEAPTTYNEAPMLADLVKAGKLPPVDERLPVDLLVTQPLESIGRYGGTLYTASWWPGVGNVLLYISEPPIKWKADLTGYEPGLAKGYEWSEDGKTFTLYLREGLRWSDGEPYTTEDWRFWWEDMATNEDYRVVSVPAWLRNEDGTPIDMEFPDDYTVVWKSKDRPLWIDPYYMAQGFWEFANPMMKPAHYLKQFHPRYNPDATYEDLELADKWWENPDFPCVFAWCCHARAGDGSRITFARNPYYFRVDTAGNQLPYIDYIDVEIVADEEVRLLNCAQGKYDTAFRICGSPVNIPFLLEQAEAGGYRLLEGWMNGAGAWPGYMVNQYYVEGGKNYADDSPEYAAEIRALLRDRRFRQALSVGFDRERVIEVAWKGIGTPQAATISPQSWHFASPEGQEVLRRWQESYAYFDPDQANAWLDEIGMTVGADGWRRLPSGKPFILTMDISDWGGSLKVQTDAAAEMEAQWEENLKIQVQVNNLQGQPDLDIRTSEGYYMLRAAHISEIDIWTYPDWIFPIVNRYMFPLEGRWFAMGGEACTPLEGQPYSCGVKPEPGSPAARLQELYRKGRATATIEDRHRVVWEAVELIIEEGPFVIGVSGDQPMPIIVKNYMRNILDFGVVGPWAPATPGNQVPAQWWMDK